MAANHISTQYFLFFYQSNLIFFNKNFFAFSVIKNLQNPHYLNFIFNFFNISDINQFRMI